MKLDLGCGYKKREGYTRVDQDRHVVPDILLDLNSTPYPFDDNSIEEILMVHVLEHIGETTKIYKNIWQELYRICKPNAKIIIEVPHWRHENFIHDPTHIRAITPVTLAMMDQMRNKKDIESGGCETTLGIQWEVDFKLESVNYLFDTTSGIAVNCNYGLTAIKPARETTIQKILNLSREKGCP